MELKDDFQSHSLQHPFPPSARLNLVLIRNVVGDLWTTLNMKEKSWDVIRWTSKAKRASFSKLVLTPRAHTDGAAAAFRDEFQLLVSTQQRWAWLGGASDLPLSAGAHTTLGGGPLGPMLGVREKKEKSYCQNIGFHLAKHKPTFLNDGRSSGKMKNALSLQDWNQGLQYSKSKNRLLFSHYP